MLDYYLQIEKTTTYSRVLRRRFYHWVVSEISRNVEDYRHGFWLHVGGEMRWLVPVIAMVITDWPEGQAMSLTKAGATASLRNCRVCEHLTKEFSITADGLRGERRVMDDTMGLVQKFSARGVALKVVADVEKESCLYMMANGFWQGELYRDKYGHHTLFPFDTLHTVCRGIADMLRDILLLYAKKYGTMDGELLAILCLACSFRHLFSYQ